MRNRGRESAQLRSELGPSGGHGRMPAVALRVTLGQIWKIFLNSLVALVGFFLEHSRRLDWVDGLQSAQF